jgi:flagellar hook-associated protein 1 FlgK
VSLSSAIYAARSGLQVSSLRAEIVATNVANATTPGYVRRSVTLSERPYSAAASVGVTSGRDRARG